MNRARPWEECTNLTRGRSRNLEAVRDLIVYKLHVAGTNSATLILLLVPAFFMREGFLIIQ